ncbi:MAG: AI-2E family transporter [Coxiellaceae bacterium]|nr:AI-2E family transporter [Coxiellaceae bacterium]
MSNRNPILVGISNWFENNFSDPAALGLFFTVVGLLIVVEFFGRILTPILVSIALAYLLYKPVQLLKRWRFPNWLAVSVVYLIFIGLMVWACVGLLPLLVKQLTLLVHEIPAIFTKFQTLMSDLAVKHPHVFTGDTLTHATTVFKDQFAKVGQTVLSFSVGSITLVITLILYLILVPIMLFFFLRDSNSISHWMSSFLPSDRSLVSKVWSEVNDQIGNYVRGRAVEMIIISVISVTTFALFGLSYAMLLGVMVGVSVVIPYVGAALVTIPVVIVGLIDWGWSGQFLTLIIAYAVIITLDANVLVPLLFSEAMDMHPVAIILAVLVFGGIWGFWGVLLAIPLATVVKAILTFWPRKVSALRA